MRASDGAVAIARPPTITDLLLNMRLFSRGPIPPLDYERSAAAEKAEAGSFTAL
jgi:hypothetical protein